MRYNINGRSALPLGFLLALIAPSAAPALMALEKDGSLLTVVPSGNVAVSATTEASLSVTFTNDGQGFTVASNGTSESKMSLASVQLHGVPVSTNVATAPVLISSPAVDPSLQKDAKSTPTRSRTTLAARVQAHSTHQLEPARTQPGTMANDSLSPKDENKPAASIPIRVEAVSPAWLKVVIEFSLFLLLLVIAYLIRKMRQILKAAVVAKTGRGYYSVSSAVIENGAGFHVRCVRPPVESKLSFSSYDRLI